MKTDPGDNLKTRTQFGEEAVQLALQGRWDEAADLNRQILDKFGPDEDANNRLGKALTELGRLEDAKKAYKATLAINEFNVIARKNVVKLDSLLQLKGGVKGGAKVDPNLFVEEMGKTVLTQLEDVSDPNVCDLVAAGDLAEIAIAGDTVAVSTVRGVRLGAVESKTARRLIKFMQGGNRYQAGVVACEQGQVRVIIREVHQDAKFAGKPSFPMKKQRATEFRPYAKESLIPRDAVPFSEDDDDEVTLEPAGDDEEEFEGMSVDEGDESADDMDFSDDVADGDLGDDPEDEES